MKLKLDGIIDPELKDFLLCQTGITYVHINYDDYMINLSVQFNQKTNPIIIMKYIELFADYYYSNLVEFDKEWKGKSQKLKYFIHDMCCEHCYMDLVMDLFENEKIKSVRSDFDFDNPSLCVEFIIEYSNDYSEHELIKYINDKYN